VRLQDLQLAVGALGSLRGRRGTRPERVLARLDGSRTPLREETSLDDAGLSFCRTAPLTGPDETPRVPTRDLEPT
jgi:hypothetical protein